MFAGFLLVLLGILMLLDKFGIIHGNFWDYAWPAGLIALGLHLVMKARKGPSRTINQP